MYNLVKNTIIIMTSNLGSEHILEGHSEKVMDDVKKHFRPEFINRIDEIIVFNPLSKEAISKILSKLIKEIEDRLKDDNIKLEITDAAKDYLVENGYDVVFGARPLKRLVSRTIEVILSKMIINNEIKPNNKYLIDYKNDEIIIEKN